MPSGTHNPVMVNWFNELALAWVDLTALVKSVRLPTRLQHVEVSDASKQFDSHLIVLIILTFNHFENHFVDFVSIRCQLDKYPTCMQTNMQRTRIVVEQVDEFFLVLNQATSRTVQLQLPIEQVQHVQTVLIPYDVNNYYISITSTTHMVNTLIKHYIRH